MTARSYGPLQFLIDGQWIDAGSRRVEPVLNPSNGEVLGYLPVATTEDGERALIAAKDGFDRWRKVPLMERSAVLRRTASHVRAAAETLAALITLELGKPLAESRREVDTAIELFEWAAEESRRSYGRQIPSRVAGRRAMVVREPVGPVAAFTGWNAPAITPARKLGYVLGAGCSIILKAAESTPATALFLARALQEAGLPPGVCNVLFGNPAVLAAQLMASPVIRAVTLTGSVSVGKHLAGLAAPTLKQTVLELGGHSPVLIFDDIELDAVATGAALAKFRNSGQVCVAPTRFYVQERLYPRFVDRMVALARSWRVGDPMDASTQMGPLHNATRVSMMEEFVADADAKGIDIVAGGRRIDRPGFFFEPTVLRGETDACRAGNEEVFGPIALVSSFKTVDEAITRANRLELGLASFVFTEQLSIALRATADIVAGSVIVNDWRVSSPETPFGGMRESGLGVEGGFEGFQAFEQTKFISDGPLADH